jgi:hypothetical protein
MGVALDTQSHLYVADNGKSRLAEYDRALVKLSPPVVVR